MGWLSVFLALTGAFISYRNGDTALVWIAGLLAILAFWSYGAMHNHAVESAKQRGNYRGGFADFTDQDLDAVPDWMAQANFAITVGATILLGIAIYRLF